MFAYAAPGIAAAVLLGLGRAFGEAIAVTQVIGGGDAISDSLFAPGRHARRAGSRRSTRAPRAAAAGASILYLAAILMVISLVTNVARSSSSAVREAAEGGVSDVPPRRRPVRHHRHARTGCGGAGSPRSRSACSRSLVRGARRARSSRSCSARCICKGLSALNLDFFTKPRPLFGEKGGIADALVGSALIVGMAMLMAMPIAVLVAIYMSEYARPAGRAFLRVVLDVLNGVPAIVVGIFVFGLLVVGHGQSAVYGAFALAILMIPMVARATQEVLEIVPRSLREASLALGVTQVAHDVEHRPPERDRRDPHRAS